MNTYTLKHTLLKRTNLMLKTVFTAIILTYIIVCIYTCATNAIEPETPWLEWKTVGSSSGQ